MADDSAERYSSPVKGKPGTDMSGPLLQCSIRLSCSGAAGMTREWLMKDIITPAQTVFHAGNIG